MNISHYIQELLFTKQKVVLPYIGSFEMVSKPAHIDAATGTITPPSKTIKFNHNVGTDYSTLVNHVAKRNGISPVKALKLICSFAEEVNNRLLNREEVEIEGIGILRVVGSGTVIFLPFSSYSNLGESFGLPTININKKAEVADATEAIAEAEAPAQEAQPEEAAPEKDAFELIDDFEEGKSVSTAPTAEGGSDLPTSDEIGSQSIAAPAETIHTQQSYESSQAEEPSNASAVEKESSTSQQVEPTTYAPFREESSENEEAAEEEQAIPEEEPSSKRGWLWPTLVTVCLLSIGIVALYHYKPALFDFILNSGNEMVVEPAVPSDVDSSYYKTLVNAAADTASAQKDSSAVDSTKISQQKADSIKAAKAKAAKANFSKKKPMTKEEMEMLINEKLKLGSAAKTSDTQQRGSVSRKVQPEAKATRSMAGGYHVIAASVGNMAEARKIAEALKSKGYSPQIMDSSTHRIRISIGCYPTSRQAASAASLAKRRIGVNAWILNP